MTSQIELEKSPLSSGADYEQLADTFRPIFKRIAEGALERERTRALPYEQITWLKEAGFGAVRVPVEYGGAGASLPQLVQLLIELAEADSSLPQALRGHFAFVEDRINATPGAAREKWLQRFVAGDIVGNAWTEVGAVKIGDVITRVSRDGDQWVVNGTKYYSTGSIFADWIDVYAQRSLVGLLLTNGPGAISAQGAKGAVSADGPESPERVQLNKALAGFLTHTGYTHGGNGYEGITFLNEAFRDSGLDDPADPKHGVDLEALARRSVEQYAQYKARQKHAGSLDIAKLPGVNHPVFKDKPVNHDPREVFIANLYEGRGEYNAFHAYYRALVQALFDTGVSRNVYCVNVDAVIAALLLKMLWQPLRRGEFSEADLETAAFTIFLYPRMLGCAAEIDDHLNRGRNMDTRTAASQCRFVA